MYYISEDEVKENLEMGETIDELEKTFLDYGNDKAASSTRDRILMEKTVYNTMPAVSLRHGLAGMKTYIAGPAGAHFVVLLFDLKQDKLIALIEANKLGQIRTGALPAMVTRKIVHGKDHIFTLVGSGFQAETQLKGILEASDVSEVRVYSRKVKNSRFFAEKYSRELGRDIKAYEDIGAALDGATIVSSITDSNSAIFNRNHLGKTYHVNLAGGNLPMRQEAADDVLSESDLVIVEHMEQAMRESGEIINFMKSGSAGNIVELIDFLKNIEKFPALERTVFKSMGIGIEDVAAGYLVLRKMDLIERRV